MPIPRLPCLILAVLLGGCAQFPALDEAVSKDTARADYPDLVPLEPLLAAIPPAGVPAAPGAAPATDPEIERLEARAAALRNRAARLNAAVLDPEARDRLDRRIPVE